MSDHGHVSLWLGKIESELKLNELTRVSYSEDGDFKGSKFSRAFKIGFFDENCSEVEYRETPSDGLSDLLKGFSYDTVITPRFVHLVGELKLEYNSIILLYNIRYSAEVQRWMSDFGVIEFIGTVEYED